MKVALITPILGEKIGNGISRYTESIIYKLQSEKIDYSFISFSKSKEVSRLKKLFQKILPISADYNFIKSLIVGTEIYHFICPELMYNPHSVLYLFLINKIFKKKIVLTFHDMMTLQGWEGRKITDKIIYKLIINLINSSDIIITNSSQTTNELTKLLRVREEKIFTIPLGADAKFKKIKRKQNSLIKLGYLAALDSVKDPIEAIRCFSALNKKYPDKYEMEMWGSGPELRNCMEKIKGLNLNNVYLKGFAPENKIIEIYNSFDIYVFPSKYEGFGLNILEASLCGVPTLIRASSKIPSETASLGVKYKTDEDFVSKVALLSKDKLYKTKIIKESMKKAKLFTWEKNAAKHIRVYRRLI
jgi:glycosyltransferase involved in cell wall biosynthesis